MKGKLKNRLLGVLLAGMMIVESVDLTALAAESDSTMTEFVSEEQETITSTQSEEQQDTVETVVEEQSSEEMTVEESAEETTHEELEREETVCSVSETEHVTKRESEEHSTTLKEEIEIVTDREEMESSVLEVETETTISTKENEIKYPTINSSEIISLWGILTYGEDGKLILKLEDTYLLYGDDDETYLVNEAGLASGSDDNNWFENSEDLINKRVLVTGETVSRHSPYHYRDLMILVENINEEQSLASGQCGDNITWRLENGTLTISGSGEMWDYTSPDSDENNNLKKSPFYDLKVKNVTLNFEGNITKIGKYAFCECSNLIGNLEVPSTVTIIEEYAFNSCSGFTGDLIIPKGVTVIEGWAFGACSGFTGKLVIPDGVKKIGTWAFGGCGFTGSLILPKSIEQIEEFAFWACDGFTGSLILPENITTISGSVFEGCSGFTGNLVIPEGVTTIESAAFAECSGFTGNLILPNGVTKIEPYVFYDCSGFTGDLVIPEGVNEIGGWAFCSCCNFTGDLIIPDSITEIGERAFNYCSGFNGKLIIGSAVTKLGNGSFSLFGPGGLQEGEIEGIYFRGNVPDAFENGGYCTAFEGITADGFYPKGSSGWEELGRKTKTDPDGKSYITWSSYIREPNYDLYDLEVYAEYANLFIGEGQTCAIIPAMVHGDDVIENEEGWNYRIENTDIADIQEYVTVECGTAARIIGKSAGNTKLHITHIPTGKSVTLTIGVARNMLTYDLSTLMDFSDNEGIMNYGIWCDNFNSEKQKDEYLVTFDAYNECASAGAVEIYDAKDQLIRSQEIKKFERYQTGVKEVFMDGWNLVSSIDNGTLLNIKNSMYTQHTPISIQVPEGGYLIITNDILSSVPAYVYNSVDFMIRIFKGAKALIGVEKVEGFKDITTGHFLNDIYGYMSSLDYKDKPWMKFQKNLVKSIAKKQTLSVEDGCNLGASLYNNTVAAMHEIDIDIKTELCDVAIDTGIDVAMDIMKDLSPSGEVLEGMFCINDNLNGIMQIVDINKTMNAQKIRIDVSASDNKLVSEGVIVENKKGVIPDNTDLVVVDITKEESSRYIIEDLANPSYVTIYNIALYRDNTEIQPNGKIRIKVPVPALYNEDRCVIFREEKDGTFTNMRASYSDGYMVFETEHLSKYILYEKILYTVSFDGNGATGGTTQSLDSCLEGEEYIFPANGYIKNGYFFKGWNTAANGSGTSYVDQAVIKDLTKTNNEMIVLYAQWTVQSDLTENPSEETSTNEESSEEKPTEEKPTDEESSEESSDPSTDKDDSAFTDAERQDLSSLGAVITAIKPKTYNQEEQEPAVKVTVSINGKKTALIEGMDYRVLYKKNINAGTATVTVKGNGIYKGSLTQNFTIRPKSLKKVHVLTGSLQDGTSSDDLERLPIYVYDGGKLLHSGIDYTLSSSGASSAAVKINITGKGNYTGIIKAKLSVNKAGSAQVISSEHVQLKKDTAVYTGKAVKSIEPVVTVKGTTLTFNKDYKVQYQNNINAGTAYMIVTGKGNYKGKVVVPFTIQPTVVSTSAVSIKSIAAKTYNGKLQKPSVIATVPLGGGAKKLAINKDYKVIYKNNLHAGTATVMIVGKGNYAGMKAQTQFTIQPQKITGVSVKGTQGKLSLTYNNRALKEGVHYEPPVYGEIKKNKIKVTIKGKGDFVGQTNKYVKQ